MDGSQPDYAPTWRDPVDYRLFLEAAALLLVARIAVAALPFRAIARHLTRAGEGGAPTLHPDRLARAVERAAVRVPWRAVCIHQGVALQRMLRRRGHRSSLVYGLSAGSGDLDAHVWVELDGNVLIGGHSSERYVEVARFPLGTAGESTPC